MCKNEDRPDSYFSFNLNQTAQALVQLISGKNGKNRTLQPPKRASGPVTKPPLTDEADLVQRTQDGDTTAFEALYRLHAGRLFGLCLRMTGSSALAEECVQDALVRAWQKIEKFRGDCAFSTWLHRITVNEVLDRQRKEQRHESRLKLIHSALPAAPANQRHGNIDLERAIDALPAGARNAFVLHRIYGYTHEECSTMLNIAPGTSKAHVHRARQLLAKRLEL